MEYLKIKKVIEQITKEEEQKELKQVKNAVKTNFKCWGDYTELIDKNGEQYRIHKKLTALQQQKPLKEQKQIIIKNINKEYNKKLLKLLTKLEAIQNAEDIKDFSISVNWSIGGTYGSQAQAELREHTKNGFKYYEGSRTGGWGYDKQSTATAEVLNQSKPILKLILNKLEKQPQKTIKKYLLNYECRDFLGYGIYLKSLIFFEGGVGFSSHEHILHNLGFKTITTHSTKTSDFFYFELKERGTKCKK